MGAARLRALLDSHGVRPAKRLGQNFVIDPNTIRKIVATAAVGPDDDVLEIGPGAGSLTVELARRARRVVAIEVDAGLVALLKEVAAGLTNVEVLHADALRVDLAALAANRLVANLPYNIAASLVVGVLEQAPRITELTVMTQKEVGDRLAAPPGSRTYGHTSVVVAYFARAQIAMRVSRRAFYPEPSVDSVVVRLVRKDRLLDVDRGLLFDVVRGTFSQRRKTLRNSLAAITGSARLAEQALARAGVDARLRPEQIGLEQFVALTRALSSWVPERA